jgi:regulator of sigma E protease
VLSFFSLLLALGILIGVHEYGHYKMAVSLGVGVERFSFGFGPVLFRKSFVPAKPWGRMRNDMPPCTSEFVLSLLPLGGYVKFLDGSEEKLPQHLEGIGFDQQALWVRVLIVLAGPLANLILAFVLLTGMFMLGVNEPLAVLNQPTAGSLAERVGFLGGDRVERIVPIGSTALEVHSLQEFERSFQEQCLHAQATCSIEVLRDVSTPSVSFDERGELMLKHSNQQSIELRWKLSESDSIPQNLVEVGLSGPWSPAVIEQVQPNEAGQVAGLQKGDLVVAVNGIEVRDAKMLKSIISESAQSQTPAALLMKVIRGGQEQKLLELEVTPKRVFDEGQWVGRVGIYLGGRPAQTLVHQDPIQALGSAWKTSLFWGYKIVQAIGKLLTFQSSLKSLAGPITMAQSAGESAHVGLAAFLAYLAMVSLNLGIFNLLPIPALDGGHLASYAWEAVMGQAPSLSVRGVLQRVGLIFILILTLLAFYNDLVRVFSA